MKTAALLLFISCPSWGAWVLVNHGIKGATGQTNNPIIPSTDCTGANFYIVGIVNGGSTSGMTITDGTGNTYTASSEQHSTSGATYEKLYYSANITGSAAETWTTSGGTLSYAEIFSACFSGGKVAPFDQTQLGLNIGSCYSCQFNSTTPAVTNELMFIVSSTESTTGTFSIDSGFTVLDQENTVITPSPQHYGGASYYKIKTNSVAESPIMANSGASGYGLMMAFEPSTGGGSSGGSKGYVF